MQHETTDHRSRSTPDSGMHARDKTESISALKRQESETKVAGPVHHGSHGHHGLGLGSGSTFTLSAQATLHCLLGCAIGEFIGLTIGVTLGLNPWATMFLATTLGFVSGYTLGLVPLVRTGKTWTQAFKLIWFGETVSIAVMELVMNATDYHVGGVQVSSILDVRFWIGFLLALPAGFLAAWPVNYWLLKREFKKPCH